MTEFEANKEGFPQGLRHCVSEIRKKNPNIQHVGVWHALVSLPNSRSTIVMLTIIKVRLLEWYFPEWKNCTGIQDSTSAEERWLYGEYYDRGRCGRRSTIL